MQPWVLIVDDHDAVRASLRSWMAATFPAVVCIEASSGEEALSFARRCAPDLALMDIGLPGINGIETTTRLKEIAPSTKVIIVSIHNNGSHRAAAAQAGAYAYVSKQHMVAELSLLLPPLLAPAGSPTPGSVPETEAGSQASEKDLAGSRKLRVLMLTQTRELVEHVTSASRPRTAEWISVGGEEALRAELARNPDLVLAWQHGGSVDPETALEIVRRDGKGALIVVLGQCDDEDAAVRYLELGAFDCLSRDRLHRINAILTQAAERRRITDERERADKERRRLAAAVEQSSETIVITDTEGRIQFVNPAFEAVTGYSREEAMGKNPRILKSGQQPQELYREMWSTLLSGRTWRGHLINRRKDGTLFEEDAVISPVRDGAGALVNFVAVKRNVTQEVALEAQLRQSQKTEIVGKLAGGVAHDFNNLLQAMLSHTELLGSHRHDPEKVMIVARELEQHISRGAALARQLLLFSRREPTRPERLDLNVAVQNTTQMLRSLIRANIALAVELSPTRLPVEVDRGQLEQVLMNLAVNASDAMPEGGTLTIRTGEADSEQVLLSVGDTGQGIPDTIRERIFEPFFTTKGAGKGTGLGLSVVHGIVTSHGGRIEVDSAVGKGSIFKVALPRAGKGDLLPAEEVEAATTPLEVGRRERILVVEDEVGTREGLRQILEALAYEVVAVGNAEEAIAVPVGRPFDALLTDLALPGMGGAELAPLFQERWPGLKVLLMSGYAEDEAVRRGCTAGYFRFLQKPFDMVTLARELRAALDGRPSTPSDVNG